MAAFSTEQILTQCSVRFKGQRGPVAVEEFLSAFCLHKDIERISDIDALRGMPLLLEDYAASWWMGVKNTVCTFEQAIALIRTTFTPFVPDWHIFVTFFETKQQNKEATDSFICKKRLLLSQLKVPPCEAIQLNLLYGMLNINIRERVCRESFNTFEQLISSSRKAEAQPLTTATTEERKEVANSNRCSFCRMKGHSIETCFKKKRRDKSQSGQQAIQQNPNLFGNHPKQPQQQDLMRKPTFYCYGCDAPGVYRSNCPPCNGNATDTPQYFALNSILSTDIGHSLPTTHVEFFGFKDEAVFDSGAKTSVASLEFKKILTANECIFQDFLAEVTLADGSISTGKVMFTICNVIIGYRIRRIKLIYLPNAMQKRTLLGTDFLEQAGIVLNMAQKYWYFEDEPKQKYLFTNLLEKKIVSMPNNEISPGTREKEMSANLMPQLPSSAKCLSPMRTYVTDSSPHYSQSIFRSNKPVEEQLHQNISEVAPAAKVRKIEQEDTGPGGVLR